jgi:Mrp family chromosome partitioning ATPase
MGKMLETLKAGEGRRASLAFSKPADGAPELDCVVDWEIGAEVPFVEVGGPGKKVELSPGLMMHPALAAPQAPHRAVEPAPMAAKPKTVNLTETKPMTAAFEPWPAAAQTQLGISPEIIAYHQPDHPTSKEYDLLLEKMRGGLAASGGVLLLIGLKPRVGTSTVLLNLAVSAAMKQKVRVVVVDAKARHTGLAKRLGQGESAGLMEVMKGTLALEQAIVTTGIAALHLLPAGLAVKMQNPLTSEAMTWLIAWLRERYDLIFVDGPTMEDQDVAAQAPHADAIYLVLPNGDPTPLNKGIAQTFSRLGGRLCGLIHTHFEL